ncbi:conjugal transfer protein TraN (plasmid) [Edwardsiella tarda]|nr:conjugal transfer protein TraN [Edwardsiella tarda]
MIACTSIGVAQDKYSAGKQFADSLKGSGVGVMEGFTPQTVIPNYTPNPPETGHYGGETATGSGGLEGAGAAALTTSEVGKLTSEVMMNRPDDPLSLEAPFISGGFEIQDKAETITNGTHDKCEPVTVNKTEITAYLCERTPAEEAYCSRKARIEGDWVDDQREQDIVIDSYNLRFYEGRYRAETTFTVPAGMAGEIMWGRLVHNNDGSCGDLKLNVLGSWAPLCGGTHMFYPKGRISPGQRITLYTSHVGMPGMTVNYYNNRKGHFVITLHVKTGDRKFVPRVVWTEICPFKQRGTAPAPISSQCIEPGGTRVISMEGKDYPVYSDCWAYQDVYASQTGDEGTCARYAADTACTVAKTVCQERVGALCLREQVSYSCEKKISGEAQLCSGQLVCANGECDQLENNQGDSFGKAVSALAAVTAAAKDVADLNGVDVRAFTGKPMFCRQAAAGFNNCCKDSGWGQEIGIAHCSSEEKALGKAKDKLLTVHVGTYCANKVLGVCLQKKAAYCQFDSKLAQIVQEQGRAWQLGVGFGGAASPDCRGITVEELQRLDFSKMNFSNFYTDLQGGTTIPGDSTLIERVKQQVDAALSQATGKGGQP